MGFFCDLVDWLGDWCMLFDVHVDDVCCMETVEHGTSFIALYCPHIVPLCLMKEKYCFCFFTMDHGYAMIGSYDRYIVQHDYHRLPGWDLWSHYANDNVWRCRCHLVPDLFDFFGAYPDMDIRYINAPEVVVGLFIFGAALDQFLWFVVRAAVGQRDG